MNLPFPLDKDRTALLVMDCQQQILQMLPTELSDAVVRNVSRALEIARSANIRVVFVTVQYRAGHIDASRRNKRVAMFAEKGMLSETNELSDIHPDLAPRDGEAVVVKRRVSALAHTDLTPLLSAMNVETLVLAGVTTSGVVLSTVRQAADNDYRVIVLEDCCADSNHEVHRALMDQVFPAQAEVLDVDAFAAEIAR